MARKGGTDGPPHADTKAHAGHNGDSDEETQAVVGLKRGATETVDSQEPVGAVDMVHEEGLEGPEEDAAVSEEPADDGPATTLDDETGEPLDQDAEEEASEASEVPEEETPPPLARFIGLEHRYGDHHALGPLDLTLERGAVGLLGPNGAGKSTLIRLMMGVLKPTKGRVEVLGKDPSSPDLRARIGYFPEGDTRFPGLTGVQAVAYAGRLVGMPPDDALQRAHLVLDYVGLGEARYRPADEYSTGMRQRLKLAQALVHDPELLILDEPTEGVDPHAREALLELIAGLERDHGLQILVSTHLLHDVERVADHALILHKGDIVEHGAIDALRTAAKRGYQVRVDGALDRLIERLDDAGITHEPAPPALRVQVDDPHILLQHVADAGLTIRQLAPVELSLDEAFEERVRHAAERPAPDHDDATAPEGEGAGADDAMPGTEEEITPSGGEHHG